MYLTTTKRYNNFGTYLRKKFSKRVFKISVDAGFSCPNIDGTKSEGGCVYCENASFRVKTISRQDSISTQLEKNKEAMTKRYQAEKFIAYFQNYSNTYAEDNKLIRYYQEALKVKDVIGIAIGTRPDCISDTILDYLNEIGKTRYVWIEYGLQSKHDETLKRINRGHDFQCFLDTYNRTRKRKNINICVHIIHGLPGETKDMMLETVKTLSDLKIDAIKIHQLHIVKNTQLAKLFFDGKIELPTLDDFLDITAKSLEIMSPDILIQRLFGISNTELLVAPKWGIKKNQLTNLIDKYLEEKNAYQGKFYKS